MKNVLLGLGMALVLALGGVGAANLAAGADHSGSGRQHAPERAQDQDEKSSDQEKSSDHGKPSEPGQAGSQHSTQVRGFAQAHRDGMRAWQTCHQAGRASCQKPAPPGWLMHPEKHPGGWPPKHHGNEKDADDNGGD